MKVVELAQHNQKKLEDFVATIASGKLRPAFFVGLDEEGEPVLHMAELTWKELAYIRVNLEAHFLRDNMGL